MITLYHGSPFEFDKPDPGHGKSFRDFGPGFYLAEEENDALSIAVKDNWSGFLYTYNVDNESLLSMFSYIEFDFYDEKWAEFIFNCRMYNDYNNFDIIIGPTAGGAVNNLFEQWRQENILFEHALDDILKKCTYTKFGFQWCFTNSNCIDFVELVDVEKITR